MILGVSSHPGCGPAGYAIFTLATKTFGVAIICGRTQAATTGEYGHYCRKNDEGLGPTGAPRFHTWLFAPTFAKSFARRLNQIEFVPIIVGLSGLLFYHLI